MGSICLNTNNTLQIQQTLLSVKAIQHFKPKTVTFENVTGLLTPDFKGYLKSVVASLLTMKYQVRVDVFNASAFGDPQHRRRLFILASRHDCLLPASPLPTHGHGGNLLPIKTCRDALQMFDKEPTSSGAILLSSTNTKIWNHIAPRLAPNMERDYELIADEPSRTVLARSRPHVHYNGSRYISVR
jgi:site-specific DNA-cytosine methylase